MKYKILWHDCEDERGGTSFEIESKDPSSAYFLAADYIKSLSAYLKDYFSGFDIECLVDETGKYHYPNVFLEDLV